MGRPNSAVADPAATSLLAARTGACAKAVAAAATTAELMDHAIAGPPTCHAFAIDGAERGDLKRRSPLLAVMPRRAPDHARATGEVR
jgi:hypothetical protein